MVIVENVEIVETVFTESEEADADGWRLGDERLVGGFVVVLDLVDNGVNPRTGEAGEFDGGVILDPNMDPNQLLGT